jgi:hypothetical protein
MRLSTGCVSKTMQRSTPQRLDVSKLQRLNTARQSSVALARILYTFDAIKGFESHNGVRAAIKSAAGEEGVCGFTVPGAPLCSGRDCLHGTHRLNTTFGSCQTT